MRPMHRRTRHATVGCVLLLLHLLVVGCSGQALFGVNLVKNGMATGAAALNSWTKTGWCLVERLMFTTDDVGFGGYECTMWQVIDVTVARDLLLTAGRHRVAIAMKGTLIGNEPSYLAVQQIGCSGGAVLESRLVPLDNIERTYTRTAQMLRGVCRLKVLYYCENYYLDGYKPYGNDFSVVLTATTDTVSSSPMHTATETASTTRSEDAPTTTASGTVGMPTVSASGSTTIALSASLSDSTSTSASVSTPWWSTSTSTTISATSTVTASRTATESVTSTLSASASMTASATRSVTASPSTTTSATITLSLTPTPSNTLTLHRTASATPTSSRGTHTRSRSVSVTRRSPSASHSRSTATMPTGSPTASWYEHGAIAVRLPVTVATQAVATVVTSAAILLSVGAAGPVLMLRMLSASSCSLDGSDAGLGSPDDDPSLYLVSPWFGDGYTMVGGNVMLVVGFAALHGVAVLLCSRCGRWSMGDAMAMLRFPHVSLQFADVAAYGICLGGWDLLWQVIRSDDGDDSGDRIASRVACWLLSMVVAVCMPLVNLYIRRCLVGPTKEGHAPSVPLGHQIACGVRLQACPLRLADLALSPRHEAFLRCIGPSWYWAPKAHRRRYAMAFNDASPRYIDSPWWVTAELCVFPVLIAAASTTRPPAAYRDVVCATVMNAVALALVAYACALLLVRPMRTWVMNPIKATMMTWVGLTCVFSSPSTAKLVGTTELQRLMAAVTLLQCLTVVLQMIVVLYLFVMLERLCHDPTTNDYEVLQHDTNATPWIEGNVTSACTASFDGCTLVDLGEALMSQSHEDVNAGATGGDAAIELCPVSSSEEDAVGSGVSPTEALTSVPLPTSLHTTESTNEEQQADLILFYLALPQQHDLDEEGLL